LVTRENGSRRDPYPPTTVSLLTKPRSDLRSASTTRIGHLDLSIRTRTEKASDRCRRTSRRARGEDWSAGLLVDGADDDAERPKAGNGAVVGVGSRGRRIVL